MQGEFLTYAFGGATKWNGRGMKAAHSKLVKEQGLNDTHFDVIVELLSQTLGELGVASDLINEVQVICESVRDSVLGKEVAEQKEEN